MHMRSELIIEGRVGSATAREVDSCERQVGRTVAALLGESLERLSRLPRTWFAEHSGIGVAERDQLLEQLEGFVLVDRALAISRLLEECPPTALAAGGADDGLSWATLLGADARFPVALRAVWRPYPAATSTSGSCSTSPARSRAV